MKHCAKKLLGFAFALALCLAVGGTALAQTPEFSDVPDTLPEQEMLAYEPNVTAVGDTTTGSLATDGYTVTIPTTVEVSSEQHTGELMVTADVRQLRILTITLDSKNNWQLKHESGQAQAGYSLKAKNPANYEELPSGKGLWMYNEEGSDLKTKKPELYLQVAQKAEGKFDTTWWDEFTVPLTVKVTDSSQATMSGTYSDTVCFEFNLTKLCVTYTINVYEQELRLAADRKSVEAVDMVDEHGNVQAGANPVCTEILEYPITYDERPWSYSGNKADDALRWEELTVTRKPAEDVDNKEVDANNNVTINLNRRYKWYYLDVNGATDYTDADVVGGNQGDHIGSCVEIKLSADGVNWTDWFWQGDGDDYWAKLPYGIHFKLGFHHVKNGYVYDTGAGTLEGNGVKIIANKEEKYTATGEPVDTSTYYVYTGQMTGEPTGMDRYNNVRYCYIPCYKKGLTYIANGGTGGTESVNDGNPPRTNVLYEETGTLKTPEELKITAPDGKSFAGWSKKSTYTTGDTLYQPGYAVSKIKWDGYDDTGKRPELDGKIDDEKRELYAIWGYDITVQFEDKTGYTADGTKTPVFGSPMIGYSFTLTGQAVEKGKGWTLDLTNPVVQEKIDAATTEAKNVAGDNDTKTGRDLERKIWKIDSYTEGGHTFDYTEDCTISAAELESGTRTLMIQRRRYLLSVISADADTGEIYGIATDPLTPQYGTFTVTVNNGVKPATEKSNTSFYQCGLNYGAEYEIKNVNAKKGYTNQFYTIFKLSLKVEKVDLIDDYTPETAIAKYMGEPYSGFMTAKKSNIHYYTDGGNSSTDIYTGDPVRVAFSKDSTTGSDTPMPGPSLAPGLSSPTPSASVALRYHANFVPEDALAETVKTVYCSAADVTVHPCMFKRAGYAFVGWNTEEDGTGTWYWVNGVPLTNWRAGETVDLYAQWRRTAAQKPVWDDPDPVDPADPDAPPEWIDDSFDADFGADPDPLPEDPDAQPDDADAAFGVDPDPQPEGLDAAFGVDPDLQPEGLDDAFGVDPGGDADALLTY